MFTGSLYYKQYYCGMNYPQFAVKRAIKIEGLVKFYLEFNSFLASSDFCRLLITFANSLDPDHDQQNVCLDLDPSYLTL